MRHDSWNGGFGGLGWVWGVRVGLVGVLKVLVGLSGFGVFLGLMG